MSDAIDLIRRFCDDWGKGASVDEIVDYFTDDAVYHNIPVDPAVGQGRDQGDVRDVHDRASSASSSAS